MTNGTKSVPIKNTLFVLNEKHSHPGQVAMLWGEGLLGARNIVWVQ